MLHKIDLIRPDDLLHLSFEFINLRIDSDDPSNPILTINDASKDAFVIVTFPPQTIAETAYFESSATKLDEPGIIDPHPVSGLPRQATAKIGNSSRLAFKVPSGVTIPYSSQGILDWSKLTPNVNPTAAIGPNPSPDEIANAPNIAEPSPNETAIELPYRLIISPTREIVWQHRTAPFTVGGRTELWHTRLCLNTGNQSTDLSIQNPASLRAIWSPDFPGFADLPSAGPDEHLGIMAMTKDDRAEIVFLTSGFHGLFNQKPVVKKPSKFFLFTKPSPAIPGLAVTPPSSPFYVPQPFYAQQLMLSSLGGWLNSHGDWIPPWRFYDPNDAGPRPAGDMESRLLRRTVLTGSSTTAFAGRVIGPGEGEGQDSEKLSLSQWVHQASQGRDHYVRIVHEGVLLPGKFPAAKIKITERKFMTAPSGIIGAYMMQRVFVIVRVPERTFTADDGGVFRANPFTSMRLSTLITPDLAQPDIISGTKDSFWLEVDNGSGSRMPFRFHCTGVDQGGERKDLSLPMMFVDDTDLGDLSSVSNAAKSAFNEFNSASKIGDKSIDCLGQRITFAERDLANPTDNTRLVTDAMLIDDSWDSHPTLRNARVRIPQVQELIGSDAATTIEFYGDYVSNGFDGNEGVFARIPVKLPVTFSAEKGGGISTPNMAISSLTRSLGPVSIDADDVAGGFTGDGNSMFDGTGTLFGVFKLGDLLDSAPIGKNAAKMQTETRDAASGIGKEIVTSLDWNPSLMNKVHSGVATLTVKNKDNLTIHSVIRKPVASLGQALQPPETQINGKLVGVDVSLADCVLLHIDEFTFSSGSGSKPSVGVKLGAPPLEFINDLHFVEDLRQAIPPGLFGSGASVDVVQDPPGVKAGFGIALPPLAVGVFALKDVSMKSSLLLPFLEGSPTFDFNFCERQHPFLLTVSLLGGGGFFAMQLDAGGMKKLEAALEFGAVAAIDIGVASGEVHILAGIYFCLQKKESGGNLTAVLTGYLRMGGSLCVLGIVSVSVEFNLSFTYESPDKVYGRATLTVNVEVLGFSKSVELTVERGFGGSGDPTFQDLFPEPERWELYAHAYA